MSVVHGGIDPEEVAALGLNPAAVLDLSANLHPDGVSPGVQAALAETVWHRYPPADAAPLRRAIAGHEGVAAAMVLPVPGATAGIHLVARAFAPGQRAVILGPTFGEYRAAVEAAGGEVVEVCAPPPAFSPPVADVPHAALGFLCNPNNPTGATLSRAEIEEAVRRLGGLLVLDVAYEPFTASRWDPVDLVRAGLPVLVLRSMTKLHAIPGVRLGYIVGEAAVIARLAALQHSWALDAAAHAVAPVALAETAERVARLAEMRAAREAIRTTLEDAGIAVAPSLANFLTVDAGDAARVRAALLPRGYVVRDCASFGLPRWVRFAVPPEAHRERFVRALLQATAVGGHSR